MKRFILPLAAVFCSSFAASAADVDATDARLWMTKNADVAVVTRGTGIDGNKAPAFARSWQCVSIPVHVEGRIKGGDGAPMFVPAMKVHVYVLFALDGKDEYVLLDKELNYTDIPLASKQSDKGSGLAEIKVGAFVSPSSAFKLSPKDGSLEGRIAAVAVEATFKDASCIRTGGDAGVTQDIIKNKQLASKLKDKWWRSKSSFRNGTGATLCSIAETPFAAQYEALGMPPLASVYGGSSSSSSPSYTPSSATGGSPYDTSDTGSDSGSSVTTADSTDSTATDGEDVSKGKKNKRSKGKKNKRD